MKNRSIHVGLLSAALLLVAPGLASAQGTPERKGMKAKGPGKPNLAIAKELKGGGKVDVKGVAQPESGDKPAANLKSGKGKGKGMEAAGTDVDARAAAVRARREAWKADPEGHKKVLRNEQQATLRAAIGALAADAAVREALARHARWLARLDWAEETAVETNNQKALVRIDELRAKELARHDEWMNTHAAKAAAPAAEEAPTADAKDGEAQ